MEFMCLPDAGFVQIRIDSTSLNNALFVVIGLSVSDDINRFLCAQIAAMVFANKNININDLNHLLKGTLSEALGMEVVSVSDNRLIMKMPVDHRTIQPFGVLNGGASMALAESAASLAGNLIVDPGHYCVGLEIKGNHLKPIREGYVLGVASPLHVGKSTQVWNIDVTDEQDRLISAIRMTLAVLPKPKSA